jgi:hypothetical protein
MAQVPVSDHTIGGIIHVQVLRDTSATDPQAAFSAAINAPGLSKSLPLHSGALNGTIHVEVDNFMVLPAGATAQTATAINCLIVFKLIEFVHLTIGSIPVTAALK